MLRKGSLHLLSDFNEADNGRRPCKDGDGPLPFPPRVLVADDNRLIREITELQLIQCGAQVSLASNGMEALEQMRRHPFDVALLDIRMPLLGGLGIVTRVRASPKDYQSVPTFVAMSASHEEQQKQQCVQVGMDDYLCKPVSQKDLSEGLARWLPAGLRGQC
jgi:two-component system, sensor histidine kinase